MFSDMCYSLTRLYDAVAAENRADSRSAPSDLLDDQVAIVRQSADLLDDLATLWSATGVDPQTVLHEIGQRLGALPGASQK
jgi:hypothetical protein